MASITEFIKKTASIKLVKRSPLQQQRKVLKMLLKKSKETEFGTFFGFESLLPLFDNSKSNKNFYHQYIKKVPVYDYDKIFAEWWHKTLKGHADVTWPGKVSYFALSSGTSGAPSKRIPVTKEQLKAMRKAGLKGMISLHNFGVSSDIFTRAVLLLGGSTTLHKINDAFEGDLSGINQKKLPFWFNMYYKPGKKISKIKDWGLKLELITKNAHKWDIGYVAGVPAWMQLLFEKIIAYYKVENIHQVWPNLQVYATGGVSYEPYRKGFEKLLGKPIHILDTYLASEGFIALQYEPDRPMKLIIDNGIFFEFVPFNEQNFDENGEILPQATTLLVDEIQENVDYAILISTVAGAWRYLIGDTIRILDKDTLSMKITGRTKAFLSLCGEHLSVDNMNEALIAASARLGFSVKEYTVEGRPYQNLFGHEWYIGTDDHPDTEALTAELDKQLCLLNDDYATERKHALKRIRVHVLPSKAFYDWMRIRGKEGSQNKFPRVIKGSVAESWNQFLISNHLIQID